ncbi:MAG: TolC family protein [Nitrospirae bacterium]|nr:TolC family protein [Nitrospirota bacterium]
MTTRALLLLAALCIPCSSPVFAQETPTLLDYKEVIQRALTRSPVLAEGQELLGFRRSQLDEARHAKFVPRFDVRYTLTPVPDMHPGTLDLPENLSALEPIEEELRALSSESGQLEKFEIGPGHYVEITATQPLFTFGKLRSLEAMARGGVAAAEYETRFRSREIIWRVSQIYFALIAAHQGSAIVDETESELRKIQDRVQHLVEKGEISQEDTQRLKLFEVELQNRRAEASLGIEQAKAGLRIAVGAEVDVAHEFPSIEPSLPALEDLWKDAPARRPDLKMAESGLSVKEAQVTNARSEFFPQLFLAGRFTLGYAPNRFDIGNPYLSDPANVRRFVASMGINQSLNLLLIRDRVRQARHDRAKSQAILLTLRDLAEADITRAYYQYQEASQKRENNIRAVRIARGWLSTAINNYTLGLIKIRDVLDAFQAYLNAKKDFTQAAYLYYTSLARLDYVAQTNLLFDQP